MEERWADDLGRATEAVADPEFRSLLQHAKVPFSRKVRAINDVLPTIDPLVRNLLCILVARGLVDRVSKIEDEYRHLLDRHRGRVRVEVTSAVALDDAEEGRIARFMEAFTQKEVVLDMQVDPLLLGGLVFRVEDKLIDGSTRTQLNGLRRSMTGSPH